MTKEALISEARKNLGEKLDYFRLTGRLGDYFHARDALEKFYIAVRSEKDSSCDEKSNEDNNYCPCAWGKFQCKECKNENPEHISISAT